MATVLIFLCNIIVEAVKTFVLNGEEFEEANEVCDTRNSGGGQWKLTQGLAV